MNSDGQPYDFSEMEIGSLRAAAESTKHFADHKRPARKNPRARWPVFGRTGFKMTQGSSHSLSHWNRKGADGTRNPSPLPIRHCSNNPVTCSKVHQGFNLCWVFQLVMRLLRRAEYLKPSGLTAVRCSKPSRCACPVYSPETFLMRNRADSNSRGLAPNTLSKRAP